MIVYIQSTGTVAAPRINVQNFPEVIDLSTSSHETSVQYDAGKSKLSIRSIFEYDLDIPRHKAFLSIRSKNFFNYNDPGNSQIKDFINEHHSDWHLPTQIFNLLRWLYDLPGHITLNLSWSLDKSEWQSINRFSMSVWLSNTPIYEESILKRYVVEKIAEPIAFNILREAQNVKGSNPRAALVLIAVALEVGAKVYISRKCPSCGRLMEAMKSSPPMHSLINSFLATLDERLQLNKETKRMVVELFEDRNKLVHTGELFPTKSGDGVLDFSDATISRINNYFDLVKDLLYHFEISIGETWVLFNTHIKDRRTIDV